ncbi:MAG: PilZ domain-containing protein [Candidatus Gastranaerophilales bacterium]|nr:PilZ domain-containing protein [Candidatus Gastranaerophilales bacterium]
MLLQDLRVSDEIVLEINWGNNLYKVPTKVVVVLKEAILVNPFVSQGVVLDLDKFHDMCYNIVSKDKKDGHVITWKNVLIQKTKYKNITLYQIESPKYAQLAQHNERRENGRTVVDKVGSISVGDRTDKKKAVIHDISSNGISFYVSEGFETNGRNILVEFDDMINDRMFHLRLECSFVREVKQNEHSLVGCSVKNAERNILEYVCLKRMSEARKEG